MRDRLLQLLPDATVVASAPGRANLIGEHTDYNGFPVLPLAIDRRVRIAVAPRDEPLLSVRNLDDRCYPAEAIPLAELAARRRRGTWVDYVVAAARLRPPPTGLEMVVVGDVPVEAGLSSSSALVVASLLALGDPGDRFVLAEEARLAERYVGTLSGGMDQAIALLARPGHALRIDFNPLRVAPVPLPDHLAVVVAHSGVRAAKSGAAREAYNARVHECSRAARVLGAPEGGMLSEVEPDRRADAECIDDPHLRRRARFVFAEAARVDAAVEALTTGDLSRLGSLLDASHAGLRDDYEVSHPAVDRLVERAVAAGACGARIVGAGFGGCVVCVVARDDASRLAAAIGPRAWVFRAAGPANRVEVM